MTISRLGGRPCSKQGARWYPGNEVAPSNLLDRARGNARCGAPHLKIWGKPGNDLAPSKVLRLEFGGIYLRLDQE
jgi:hypothetical protein